MTRVLTGAALVLFVIVVVRLAPLWLAWTLLATAAVVAAFEFRALLQRMQRPPWPIVSVAGVLATMSGFHPQGPPLSAAFTATVLLLLVRGLLTTEPLERRVDRLLGSLLLVVYIGLPLGHVGGLLHAGPRAPEDGQDLLLFAIAAVYFGDVAAFYGGRALGQRKLAPQISPGKTWEGAVCGVLGATVGAFVASAWWLHKIGMGRAVILGFAVGAAGILGDLVESMFKRSATLKDSGRLLPGHGGLLDRLDSLLLAAPLVYWYHQLVLAAGG